MVSILVHYFLFVALLYIAAEKLKLQEKAMDSKYKIIYRLGRCNFCFSFWVAVLTVLVIDCITLKFGIVDLIMPFVITGAWITLNGLENE